MPTAAQVRQDVEAATTIARFVETEILERVPWIFKGDSSAFGNWRLTVAGEIGLVPEHVYLVGSAAVGYSLSPLKVGRDFRPIGSSGGRASDVDIAVVDADLFHDAWDVLVRSDRDHRLALPMSQVAFADQLFRMRMNVYWGSVSDAVVPRGSSAATRLRSFLAATTRSAPLRGHTSKARVYRRREDLVAYHEQSLRQMIRAAVNTGETS